MFDISKENNEIHLSGRFDASQVEKANEIFDDVETTYIVNFEGLDYISSAGLSVLLKVQKRLLENDHQLKLMNMKQTDISFYHNILRIITIMHLIIYQ